MASARKSVWKIAEAKARFSALVRAAERRPQVILNRDRPVAAVIDSGSLAQFESWQRDCARSLAEATEDLRKACEEEGYEFAVRRREDRRNDFLRAPTDRPR